MPLLDEESVERLIQDSDFRLLAQRLDTQTIFHVLGYEEHEPTHSRVLAWLLNPSEPHGLDSSFLRKFIEKAAKHARDRGGDLPPAHGTLLRPLHSELLEVTDVEVTREFEFSNRRRIDIVVSSRRGQWVIGIENKINSAEGLAQTEDYYAHLLQKFPPEQFVRRLYVYLTPKGSPALCPQFASLSYADVNTALMSAQEEDGITSLGKVVVDQYRQCLESNVQMTEDEIRRLSWLLYRRHSRAIDKIQAYGRGSLLAHAVLQGILDDLHLRPIGGAQWRSSTGTSWMALWADGWPVGPRNYQGYYGIWWTPGSPEDTIRIGMGFDGPSGDAVKSRFARPAEDISPRTFTARKPVDVDSEAIAATGYFRNLIESTCERLSHALDQTPEPSA